MPHPVGSLWERRLLLCSELAALGLAILALVRVLQLDTNRLGILIVTFLPWLLLPAYLLVGIGLGARRWRLVGMAMLLVVAHVSWVWAELPDDNSVASPSARAAETLRLTSTNVLAGNSSLPELLDTALDGDAHVVALQEMGWRERSRMNAHPLADAYPHRYADTDLGIVLLSRLPIVEARILGRGFPAITVAHDEQLVTIVAVHTATPLWHTKQWIQDLENLTDITNQLEGRVILMGDFNSTMQHRQFRDFLDDANLTDSHKARGSGWGATWPQSFFLGPQLRLDHVLVSDGVEVLFHTQLQADGSDHRAISAWVGLVPVSNS